MEKNTFNHDKFNTWEKCRKRYYFKYIKELRWPELEDNYRLGQSVHALADYYLRGLKVDHLLKNADKDIKTHWEALKNHPILENQVLVTEWAFNSRIGNSHYWLNGRIDAIFYDKKENQYIIADWKTGQNIPHDPDKSLQSMIYLYSFFNARKDLKLDITHKDIIFQYIKTPDLDDHAPIVYSQEKEREYEDVFLKTIKEIETEKAFISAKPCPLKKHCPYIKLCT